MIIKFLKALNDNHNIIIGIIVVALVGLYAYGCNSQVKGIIDSENMLNRAELQTEVDYLLSQARNRFDELDRQDEIKLLIFDQAALFAQTGAVNPMGLLTTAVSIAAVSFGLDQRRKKKQIEKEIT